MIRSTKHSIKYSNTNKKHKIYMFLSEYQRIGQLIIDDIWTNGYKSFCIKDDNLTLPKYLDYNEFSLETKLSARCLSSLVTQISGMIRASVEKRKKLIFQNNKYNNLKINLQEKKNQCVKPTFPRIAELSSKNIDFNETDTSFEYYLTLKCMGLFDKINIPIKETTQSIKWKTEGKRLGSFLIKDDRIEIRYEINKTLKENGLTLGADQGMKTVLTLSNGDITKEKDMIH